MGSIRKIDVQQIRKKCKITTLIETGTLYGDGVDFALESGFEKIISIEINEQLVELAKKKYANEPRVTIIHGNSPDALRELLPTITEPVVFWLDAHFPGCDANLASYKDEIDQTKKVPLEQELEIIASHNYDDIVICDDLWIYEDWNTSSGTFNEHCNRHGHDIRREELCEEGTLERFEKLFEKTHKVIKIYEDQGYLVFIPNESN
jgi:hypothetical protein